MTFDEIFEAYYTLYRGEQETPASTDAEYTIALRLSKEAINYWANYDATYWKELFSTLQSAATGTKTITAGTTSYAAPTNMREAGGFVKILDNAGKTVRSYPIVEPQEAQFKNDNSQYAYFTGNPSNGFVLHLNPVPDTSINGFAIDYVYYAKPTYLTSGTEKTEMSDPMFIVHRMLGQRFRVSRNPYYETAIRDAENAIRVMQMDNNSGTWANPWKLADNSGSSWGS